MTFDTLNPPLVQYRRKENLIVPHTGMFQQVLWCCCNGRKPSKGGLFTSWPPFGPIWNQGDFNDTLMQPNFACAMCKGQYKPMPCSIKSFGASAVGENLPLDQYQRKENLIVPHSATFRYLYVWRNPGSHGMFHQVLWCCCSRGKPSWERTFHIMATLWPNMEGRRLQWYPHTAIYRLNYVRRPVPIWHVPSSTLVLLQ